LDIKKNIIVNDRFAFSLLESSQLVRILDGGYYYLKYKNDYSCENQFCSSYYDLYFKDEIVISDVVDCYIADDFIYYFNFIESNKSYYTVYRYSLCNEMTEILEIVGNLSGADKYQEVTKLFVHDDSILYLLSDKNDNVSRNLFIYDLKLCTKQEILIENCKINSINVFGDFVYICTDLGLFSYEIASGILQCISTVIDVSNCYIVDDLWVYFDVRSSCCGGARLFRVKQEGGIAELVFDNLY